MLGRAAETNELADRQVRYPARTTEDNARCNSGIRQSKHDVEHDRPERQSAAPDANGYDLGSIDGAMTLLYCRLAKNTEHVELDQQCNHA